MPSSRVGLCLPWPDKKLSPNARQHWAQRCGVVKRARSQAYLLARGSMTQPGETWAPFQQAGTDDQINVRLTFEPPARYRYDIKSWVLGEVFGMRFAEVMVEGGPAILPSGLPTR